MAGKIPEEFIDQLMARIDIVDVIDRRVPLTKKGKEYMACCPFHDEKTPSFSVSPSKQFYHCFGCKAHGTAIGFLMQYDNLSFVEAVEELADQVGMSIPKQAQPYNSAPNNDGHQLLSLMEQASYWFQQQLRQHADARDAIAYLKARGLNGQTAAAFAVGYAPDSWDDLLKQLGQNDPSNIALLHKGGLLIEKTQDNQSKRYYDRFRGRIIFPIEDYRGRVVGFGGRIIDQGEPKYLNSPETPLFHKGAELYNLHRARRAIGDSGYSLVVEGYMDVIGLAQFGIDNAVATLGTATTRTHLQRLFRLSNNIVFCFDGDRAGRDAAWKAMQTALPELQDGREIRFLFLNEGDDPDSLVRQNGKAHLLTLIEQAQPFTQYFYAQLSKQVDLQRMEGKARLVSLAQPFLDNLPDGALKKMMLNRLSELSGLSHDNVSSLASNKPTVTAKKPAAKHAQNAPLSPLAMATALILQYPQLGREYDKFDDAIQQRIAKLHIKGGDTFAAILTFLSQHPDTHAARVLEAYRQHPHHNYLEKLVGHPIYVNEDALEQTLLDLVLHVIDDEDEARRMQLLDKARQHGSDNLTSAEKSELTALFEAKKERQILRQSISSNLE